MYATALYELAESENYQAYYHELVDLTKLVDALSPAIWRFNSEPEAFLEIRDLLDGKISPILLNFLTIIVNDGFIHRLDTITHDYLETLIENEVVQRVTVKSAKPLTPSLREKIEALITKRWGSEAMIQVEIDPSLIGGISLSTADEHYDMSIGSRLDKIKEELKRDTYE